MSQTKGVHKRKLCRHPGCTLYEHPGQHTTRDHRALAKSASYGTIAVTLPDPYPDGLPCGVGGHLVWCRCKAPRSQGEREDKRVRALNEKHRAHVQKYSARGGAGEAD